MSEHIIDKIDNYFESVKEQYGEVLFLEKTKKKNKLPNKVKKTIVHNNNVKEIPKPDSLISKTDSDDIIGISGEPNINVSNGIQINWKDSKTLEELYKNIHNCQKCPLSKTRTNFVFGTGNPNADIMVIGEAPGADEDEQGKPFVGKAGQLLTKILAAIKLERDEVYIANILKCRPPNNRKPFASEENECEPFLKKQIELIKPAFILALGLTAVDCLLKKTHKMGDIRGSVLEYHGIKMLVTYHPAALLRNPNWKPLVWEDVKLLRRLYDEYLANKQKDNL
jgi:DNA polymerase